MQNYIETDIKEVKEQLVWNHQNGYKAIVLLGSGISVSGGIPSSEGIISKIRTDFSSVCARTHPVTYEDHLAVLTAAQRQTLIKNLVSGARLNQAHLYFATLAKAGYVDKIITTNFDTLLHKALALENVYPNIFDFTASQSADSADFSNISLFHMHGQKDGMLNLQDEDSYDQYIFKMKRFFGDSLEKQTVIVVGYSGSDDPVFHYLSDLKGFENRLYWVGHNQAEPEEHVVRGILQKTRKQACFIKGYDADTFFVELSSLLGLEAPRILSNPMGLVKEVLGHIAQSSAQIVTPPAAKTTIPAAPIPDFVPVFIPEPVAFEPTPVIEPVQLEEIQEVQPVIELEAAQLPNLTDEIEESPVIEEESPAIEQEIAPELIALSSAEEPQAEIEIVSTPIMAEISNPQDEIEAWLEAPVAEEEVAVKPVKSHKNNLQKAEEDELVQLARETWSNHIYDNYQRLTKQVANTESEEARKYFSFFLFNWGAELEKKADQAAEEEAETLYNDAFKKYEEAIQIKPDLREAYNNWGVCLRNLAKTRTGAEADLLYQEAFQKFEEAILINPEEHEPYNNWAIGLANLAETKNDVEAEKLYAQAFEKYQEALVNKPDLVEVYNNWGVCLKNLATLKKEDSAESLYREAFGKFKQATRIKPSYSTAWVNWGVALRQLARMQKSSEAISLYQEAIEKYAEALENDPNAAHALNNWGVDLGNLAMLKGIDEATQLLETAFHKYELALQINPDLYEAYNNWGIDLWNLGNLKSGPAAEELYAEAFRKFDLANSIQPRCAEIYTNKGICQQKVAGLHEHPTTDVLFKEAFYSFKKATDLKPRLYEACYNWGIALRNYARKAGGETAEGLYIKALKQFEKAMKAKPEKYKLYRIWDASIVNLSDQLNEEAPEKLYHQTFKEYQEAIFTERSSLEFYNNYDLSLTMPADALENAGFAKLMETKIKPLLKA
jgi:tetratricopeptide (TPR) repeat protein/NAD-dependent SIR2 family protein deacetylase